MQGSIINRILENSKPIKPEIGMGATIFLWSDRLAGTVTNIYAGGREVEVQEDKATRTDGNEMSESQEYRFEPDPNGRVFHFTLRKNGRWVERGSSNKNGRGVQFGDRRKYHDYSF